MDSLGIQKPCLFSLYFRLSLHWPVHSFVYGGCLGGYSKDLTPSTSSHLHSMLGFHKMILLDLPTQNQISISCHNLFYKNLDTSKHDIFNQSSDLFFKKTSKFKIHCQALLSVSTLCVKYTCFNEHMWVNLAGHFPESLFVVRDFRIFNPHTLTLTFFFIVGHF